MTPTQQKRAAWDEYNAIQKPAHKTYTEAVAPFLKAYNAIVDPAWATYHAKIDAIGKDPETITLANAEAIIGSRRIYCNWNLLERQKGCKRRLRFCKNEN